MVTRSALGRGIHIGRNDKREGWGAMSGLRDTH